MIDSAMKSSPSADPVRRAKERDMIPRRMLRTKPKPHQLDTGGAKKSAKSLKA
jgi:hypothetical protein